MRTTSSWLVAAALCLGAPPNMHGQRPARPAVPAPTDTRSAPITNIRYDLTIDSNTVASRLIKVAMSFDVTAAGPILLSFPIWTPGAYEVSNFARWVENFDAGSGDKHLRWDKLDYDTWRIDPAGARAVTVRYDFVADTLDNAIAWSQPDFAFFNGTNLFPYPEGRGAEFRATVGLTTQASWTIVTGMRPGSAAGTFTADNYHDLVDMPFFVGRVDLDSLLVEGKWTRFASYPVGVFTGAARDTLKQQTAKMIPVMASVFQETPWDRYTTLLLFNPGIGGGSALEHQNSHIGIYNPGFIGNPLLASITGHEIFHAWNVKRLRPADLVPYRYGQPQPTTWLWVSEGITDYYADLAMVRAGVIDSAQFLSITAGKVSEIGEAPPIALEDASLSTWIGPVNGTRYLYYPKGSLAGFMLDILIRDASDNHRSLDDVMRELYRTTYKQGRGFTGAEWWRTVTQMAGGRTFTEFNAKYIDGRAPLPWDEILPLGGLRLVKDTIREPVIGVGTRADSGNIVVSQVLPNSSAAQAGVRVGDRLLAIGGIELANPDFGTAYRTRFAQAEGDSLPIKVRRGADTLTLTGTVRLSSRMEITIEPDPRTTAKAARIRNGILRGTVDR